MAPLVPPTGVSLPLCHLMLLGIYLIFSLKEELSSICRPTNRKKYISFSIFIWLWLQERTMEQHFFQADYLPEFEDKLLFLIFIGYFTGSSMQIHQGFPSVCCSRTLTFCILVAPQVPFVQHTVQVYPGPAEKREKTSKANLPVTKKYFSHFCSMAGAFIWEKETKSTLEGISLMSI